jgi:hypothetical protein
LPQTFVIIRAIGVYALIKLVTIRAIRVFTPEPPQ